jgi:hypothetical protein
MKVSLQIILLMGFTFFVLFYFESIEVRYKYKIWQVGVLTDCIKNHNLAGWTFLRTYPKFNSIYLIFKNSINRDFAFSMYLKLFLFNTINFFVLKKVESISFSD